MNSRILPPGSADALARELAEVREQVAALSVASRLAAIGSQLESLLATARTASAQGDLGRLAGVLSEATRIGEQVAAMHVPGLEARRADAVALAGIIRRLCGAPGADHGRTDVEA